MGFSKAFGYGNITQITSDISKPMGLFWLVASMAFTLSAVYLLLNKDNWWGLSLIAAIISQLIIFYVWKDANYASIINIIILIAIIVGYANWSFAKKYKSEIAIGLKHSGANNDSLLTEKDISHLPEPIKKYIRYTGSLNNFLVNNFSVEFSGHIREKQCNWMPFTSTQYNFINASTRLFFMKAVMKHLPVKGFHCFKNDKAYMDIRILSLFKVQYKSGKEMDIAETVTFFNDMCCMAPATLIDKRITWMEIKDDSVKASFTNNGITISAWLYFNDKGELINFISEDRYALMKDGTMQKLTWSTPLKDYKIISDRMLATSAEAIYTYPEKKFTYGKFKLKQIKYNCKDPK